MSIYSVYKCTSISGNSGSSKNTLQDISLIKADLLKEEHREEEQQNRITKINSLIGNKNKKNRVIG